MNYDHLLELVKNRRSFRRFKRDAIPEGSVEKVLEVARFVPSAGNSQPWEFVVVKDDKVKRSITKNIALKFGEAEKIDPDLYTGCAVQPHMHAAPVLIVVCGDPRLEQTYPKFLERKILLHQSLAICIYGMELAAASLGLATAWATIQGGPPEEEVKKLLDIPDVLTVDHIVPLGYPDEESEQKNQRIQPVRERARQRRPLNELVHYGKYDRSRLRSDKEIEEFIWSKSVTRIQHT